MNFKKVINELKHGVLEGEREYLIADTGLFLGFLMGAFAGVILTLIVWLITSSI